MSAAERQAARRARIRALERAALATIEDLRQIEDLMQEAAPPFVMLALKARQRLEEALHGFSA